MILSHEAMLTLTEQRSIPEDNIEALNQSLDELVEKGLMTPDHDLTPEGESLKKSLLLDV